MRGVSLRVAGVYGESEFSHGIFGVANGASQQNKAGVKGFSANNPGVLGSSFTTHGVVGLIQNAQPTVTTRCAVLGQAGAARGVYGQANNGVGVYGQAGAGVGVLGSSTVTGVGGQFQGGRAQLYLVPAPTTGTPTTGTHKIGELFLDKAGALFLCKAAGSPGTWVPIA